MFLDGFGESREPGNKDVCVRYHMQAGSVCLCPSQSWSWRRAGTKQPFYGCSHSTILTLSCLISCVKMCGGQPPGEMRWIPPFAQHDFHKTWSIADLNRLHGRVIKPKSLRFNREELELIDRIFKAEHITIEYIDNSDNKTLRKILPRKMVNRGKKSFLFAHCLLRDEDRFFDIKKIISIRDWNKYFYIRNLPGPISIFSTWQLYSCEL